MTGNELLVRKLPRADLQELLIARQSLFYLVKLIVNNRTIIEISRGITVQGMNFVQCRKSFRKLV